ncbi:MAG: hypothetical protein CMM42_12855 [Rhodospirillaceae bacterium]|jgi:hypothetical protein|nr:hypothetical protein [Rhodospirillaceae bacterium]
MQNLVSGKTVTERAKEGPIGRTALYIALNAGELKAKKLGRRTIILDSEWQRFLASLPDYEPGRKVA